jgi:uncharacterized protein YkwD
MRGRVRRFTVLVLLLLAIAASITGGSSAADAAPATSERLQALDQAILVRLNAVRTAHGLRPLAMSADLQEAAVAHSRSMLESGLFSHDSRDGTSFVTRLRSFYRPRENGLWSAGENILYNKAEIDADTAVQVWLNSPPHRRNMLDPTWREVGIGSMHADSAGGDFGGAATWVITVDFGVRSGPRAAARPTPVFVIGRSGEKARAQAKASAGAAAKAKATAAAKAKKAAAKAKALARARANALAKAAAIARARANAPAAENSTAGGDSGSAETPPPDSGQGDSTGGDGTGGAPGDADPGVGR